MLTLSPQPLSQPDQIAVAEWLSHKGKMIVERVVRGQVAACINKSADLALKSPLNVLAKGPEPDPARQLNIQAAKLTIFLDVLAELSRAETQFEMAKFDVE
jgi:hypothetical protein